MQTYLLEKVRVSRPPPAELTCAALSALLGGFPVLRACVSLHVQPAIAFFDTALAAQLPALAARLAALAIPSDLYLVPWLLTIRRRQQQRQQLLTLPAKPGQERPARMW